MTGTRSSAAAWTCAALLAAAAGSAVWQVAWVSEDCFITFRYVSNTLAGHGPVFNPGEAVQGYTHPLWFGLLLLGGLLVSDPIELAVGLGLLLTIATVIALTRGLQQLAGDALPGTLLATGCVVLFASSNAWLSFQTGGLENALAHLWIVVLACELARRDRDRPFVITALGAGIVLTRPDLSLLFAPVAGLLLPRLADAAGRRAIALGSLPLFLWLGFSLSFYGDVVPNTAHAKVGIFEGVGAASLQGLVYLADWARHEPVSAAASGAGLAFAVLRPASTSSRALAFGSLLFLGYVVGIGGDFMRGRFLLPVFVAAVVLGSTSLAVGIARGRLRGAWAVSPALAGAASLLLAPPPEAAPGAAIPRSGIVDERLFYPGYSLAAYRETGALSNPILDLDLARRARDYARTCGSFALHLPTPGTFGYLAGPDVVVIDILGLTDATIARLPRERLLHSPPRVGHPFKRIPVAYLAQRGDIAILRGWQQALARGDCSYRRAPTALVGSKLDWQPGRLLPPPAPDPGRPARGAGS